MKSSFIHTGEPELDGNELRYIKDCFDRNWISSGKYVKRLEETFARYIGVKYAVAVSSGTAAIHLGLLACNIGPGDEVIIPDFTIIVSASMLILVGAKPTLVDVDKYWCIDPKKIEAKITKKTKAVMPVHMYGNPADMEQILKIAKKYNLKIIEDACAAIGAETLGKKVGSIGDIGCFSLYTTKTITSGEGGMLVTNNKKMADRLRLLRNQAFEDETFIHKALGFSYRMSDITAAIGLAQLEKIDEKVKKKRKIASQYNDLLKNVLEIEAQKEPPWGKSAPWMFGLTLKDAFGKKKDDVIRFLKKEKIEARSFFTPLHNQPVFKNSSDKRYPDIKGSYRLSEKLGELGLYLPSGLGITAAQQKKIITKLLSLKT